MSHLEPAIYNSLLIAGTRTFDGNRIVWKFHSEFEFAEQIMVGHRNFRTWGDGSRQRGSAGYFNSHTTFEEFHRDMQYGWKELGTHGEQIDLRILAKDEDYIQTQGLARDISGYRPDVAAFVAGDPENMFVTKDTMARGPVLSILAATTGTSDITNRSLKNRGTALAYWIDMIESAGIRVEFDIWGAITSGTGGTQYQRDGMECHYFCQIKRAQDPMEYNRIATAISTSDIHRRATFALLEQNNHPSWAANFRHGYGRNLSSPPKDMLSDDPLIIRNVRSNEQWVTVEKAIETIRQDLDDYLDIHPYFEFRTSKM